MTAEGIAKLLIGLGAAAGRAFGMAEAEVYGKVLESISDELGLEAGERLWGFVSWERPPSPGLVLEQAHAILRCRPPDMPALPEDTGEPVSEAAAREQLAKIRGTLAMTSGPLSRPLARIAQAWPAESGAADTESEGRP